MVTTKHAPPDPCRVLERRHGLADIVERRTGVLSLLRDSRFGLTPRGDGRWAWRFAELMQAGVIPVVLAAGLSLPFHHLVDWTAAALQRRVPIRRSRRAASCRRGRAGRPGTSSSPRDCLGSLTPRQLFILT